MRKYVVLSEKDIEKVRKLHATGKFTQFELANRFGVNQSTISRVISNKQKRKDR